MQRRAFITLLGTAAIAPRSGQAQPIPRSRRVGVVMLYEERDPEGQRRATAFRQTLEKLGWTIGGNLEIDYKWGVGDANWIRAAATDLMARTPDVILANGGPAMRPVREVGPTVPMVFIGTADPVADGFVQSLARPGGNTTGFTALEPSVGAKLLDLLKEIAPRLTRVAVLINPKNPGSLRLADAAISAGPKAGVAVSSLSISDVAEIEPALSNFGSGSDGLIVPPDPTMNTYRRQIAEIAARRRLPAIYSLRHTVVEGGLMSYGVDIPELFRQAAAYIDLILKGTKPADLPVQRPTKFEMAINGNTAKALGLTVSPLLIAQADEVIE